MRIRFEQGHLFIEPGIPDLDLSVLRGVTWDVGRAAWRARPSEHSRIVRALRSAGHVFEDESAPASLGSVLELPPLLPYQRAALASWTAAGHRGVVALPAGAGRFAVALAAIAQRAVATLIMVANRVSLAQWTHAFEQAGLHATGTSALSDRPPAVAIATYDTCGPLASKFGGCFGLVVVDEAHQLGTSCSPAILDALVAEARLGLAEPAAPASDALVHAIGRVTFALTSEQLAAETQASFRIATLAIALEPAERATYRELMSTRTRAGRRASHALLAYPSHAQRTVGELLERHRGERVLLVAGDEGTAMTIARQHGLAHVTSKLSSDERAATLARFRSGEASVLVSAHVLDADIDAPEADVGILVAAASCVARRGTRLARMLRPRHGQFAHIYELLVCSPDDRSRT